MRVSEKMKEKNITISILANKRIRDEGKMLYFMQISTKYTHMYTLLSHNSQMRGNLWKLNMKRK